MKMPVFLASTPIISRCGLGKDVMSAHLKRYLASIENALKAGAATEHTHRPALKILLESFAPEITATNEPKHIDCGAPDFMISRNGPTHYQKIMTDRQRHSESPKA
jgi:hypothetical protein